MKLSPDNCRFCKFVSWFISGGIFSVKELKERDSVLNFVKFSIVEGISPEIPI
jgi:hypothetical protein